MCANIRHHNQLIHRISLLIESRLIKKNEGAVLLALASHSNPKGLCFPSQSRLAQITGYKRETVNRLIKRLESRFISKNSNRRPVAVNGKTYYPRTIYKIFTGTITKMVKSALDKLSSSGKSDHSAPLKNDHTNKPSVTQENTVMQSPKGSVHKFDLKLIVKNAIEHQRQHISTLRQRSAKALGLKRWQIKMGLRKPDHIIEREEKNRKKVRKAHEQQAHARALFDKLQNKLIAYRIEPSAFTLDDFNELESLLMNKALNANLNALAQHNLDLFKEKNS